MMDDSVKKFVETHDDFEFCRDNTKVRCKLTNQDFPGRLPLLEEYCKSKSYNRAKNNEKKTKKLELNYDWSKYQPHIIQHKQEKGALFCQLTGSDLNKIPAEVEKHVSGKRFQAAKKEFEELLANDADVSEEEEEDEEDSELAGIEEVDFTPAAKKRKIEDSSAKKEDEKIESAAAKPKVTTDDAKKQKDAVAKKVVTKKAESVEAKKTAKKERLLPAADEESGEEDDDTTVSMPAMRLNKKAKKRLEASETEEQKKDKQREAALKNATEKEVKQKSCKQKRLVNSKTRRKQKAQSSDKSAAEKTTK